jgi:hypothetical protein
LVGARAGSSAPHRVSASDVASAAPTQIGSECPTADAGPAPEVGPRRPVRAG